MIYRLGQPVYFAGLVLGFLLGCLVHVAAQRWTATRFGGPAMRWMLPSQQGLGRYVDPFGAVAALLGGVGWPTPVEAGSYQRAQRTKAILIMLTGPLANLLLSAAGLALLARTDSGGALGGSPSMGDIFRGHLGLSSDGPTLLAAIAVINMFMAVLSLIPLPPLEGGRIMFLLAPRTLGWQKAEYYLVERNIGIGILLLGLILSLGANPAPIAYIVITIADPLLTALFGAFGG
jgi:membrane-associated protease RseP (regulator of RpoE activity)